MCHSPDGGRPDFTGVIVGADRADHRWIAFASVVIQLLREVLACGASATSGGPVGVGPIEFMGEAALRARGGLSDVDGLVEESA